MGQYRKCAAAWYSGETKSLEPSQMLTSLSPTDMSMTKEQFIQIPRRRLELKRNAGSLECRGRLLGFSTESIPPERILHKRSKRNSNQSWKADEANCLWMAGVNKRKGDLKIRWICSINKNTESIVLMLHKHLIWITYVIIYPCAYFREPPKSGQFKIRREQ